MNLHRNSYETGGNSFHVLPSVIIPDKYTLIVDQEYHNRREKRPLIIPHAGTHSIWMIQWWS